MNLTTLKRVLVIILTGLAIVISGCEKSATPSLYVDDEPADRPNPVVTGVEPADAGLAGIGTVTIHGNNFSTVMDENLVFFGKDRATVVSANANQIVVSTPNIIADSLELKVAVVGAFGFSNIMRYSLQNAILPYGIYGPGSEQLFGITIDKDENLYVSITPRRIDRVSVDTTEVSFATSTGVIKADNMRIGPNGNLYFVRKTNRLYRLQSGSTTSETYLSNMPDNNYDLDFDATGFMYIAGEGDNITSVDSDGNFQTVADYPGIFIKALRVYNGYVYVAGTTPDTLEKVWRNPINVPGNLGPSEEVFNLTSALGANIEIFTMTFDETGNMYLGMNTDDPILIVHPDGSFEPLYPGLWIPNGSSGVSEVFDIEWGNDIFMYVNRRHEQESGIVHQLLKVNMLKMGAPYYGRN